MNEPLNLDELASYLKQFAADRDWGQFHTPKNLAMALAGEAGELLEIFQWLTPEQSAELDAESLGHVGEELADILIYLVRLADVLGLSLAAAVSDKQTSNEARYVADEVRGSAEKR